MISCANAGRGSVSPQSLLSQHTPEDLLISVTPTSTLHAHVCRKPWDLCRLGVKSADLASTFPGDVLPFEDQTVAVFLGDSSVSGIYS